MIFNHYKMDFLWWLIAVVPDGGGPDWHHCCRWSRVRSSSWPQLLFTRSCWAGKGSGLVEYRRAGFARARSPTALEDARQLRRKTFRRDEWGAIGALSARSSDSCSLPGLDSLADGGRDCWRTGGKAPGRAPDGQDGELTGQPCRHDRQADHRAGHGELVLVSVPAPF